MGFRTQGLADVPFLTGDNGTAYEHTVTDMHGIGMAYEKTVIGVIGWRYGIQGRNFGFGWYWGRQSLSNRNVFFGAT